MKKPRSDRIILFDLGGVLVENTGEQGLSSLLPYQLDRKEIWARWLASDEVRRFECGRISPEVFAARFPEFAQMFDEVCVLRYDNEADKGDHRHFGGKESVYRFTTPEQLLADFQRDITRWNNENRDA